MSLGYAAATFVSAEEFLGSDKRAETDCVITDVKMPTMSGLELQARLASIDQDTPVIFMTAFPEERTRALALAAGAVGFLQKPFSEEGLITCIKQALNQRNSGRAGQAGD